MQVSEQWLREWVNPPVDTHTLAESFTLLGLEVDAVAPVAAEFSGVVVAEVVSREQHPNADRLSFCRLDAGDGQLLEVVCGASNVRQGLKVAFVKIGGVLPGDFHIKKATLRGVDSYGMICSARELGMKEERDGIIELPADAPVGMDFREYLSLNDNTIDIELTPNRGDCASVLGLARELAAKFALPLQEPSVTAVLPSSSQTIAVSSHQPAACPRYLGRVITGLRTDAITPLWMQNRLMRSGLHPIHPFVDVTNYVMLELGQPMHAFDLAKLGSSIEIRQARAQESIELLNGKTVSLAQGTLVIADQQQVLAVAGVMGGQSSAVSASTSDIFLECAYFDPIAVSQSSRQLGVVTDSSYRFERGVDFTLQARAMERCCELLQAIAGGTMGPVTELVHTNELPPRKAILLRAAQITRLLGVDIPAAEVSRLLSALGMHVTSTAEGWQVVPPSYRYDVSLEVDLIEEVARLHGYASIPTTTLTAPLTMLPTPANQVPYLRISQHLMDRGYTEAITYSFVDPTLLSRFQPQQAFLSLINPLSQDMSAMRTSLLPGLLQAVQYNLNRQAERVRLFEVGLSFVLDGDELRQIERVAGVWAGRCYPLQWGQTPRAVDFFDIKGDVENLFAEVYKQTQLTWEPANHPALHPGQSAAVMLAGQCVGYVGILHPALVAELDLAIAPAVFELDMLRLSTKETRHYQNISKFPAVRRDLAIVMEDKISAEALARNIRRSAGHLLIDVTIFDIYQGASIGPGMKSVALGMVFQDATRTLVDADVNSLVDGVVAGLQQEFNATLRA